VRITFVVVNDNNRFNTQFKHVAITATTTTATIATTLIDSDAMLLPSSSGKN
jgi:hypothetical protein